MKYFGIKHVRYGPLSLSVDSEISSYDDYPIVITRYHLLHCGYGKSNLFFLEIDEDNSEQYVRERIEKIINSEMCSCYDNSSRNPYHEYKKEELEIYEIEL